MTIMKSALLFLFISVMRLRDTTVLGQTGICNLETRHACERSGFFRLCRDIGGGRLQPEGPEIACQLWNEQSTCYGGSSHLKTVCGVAPPRCTREGTFLVPGRCRDFYICKNIGSKNFQQFLGECLPDHIFDVMKSECMVDVGDGCSIYTTSSLCSTTTIEMTTTNIPFSTSSTTITSPETKQTTTVTPDVQEPMTSTSRQTLQESTTKQQETTLGQTSTQKQTIPSSTTQQETTAGQTSSQSQTTPSLTTKQETTLVQTSTQSQTTPSATTQQQETTLGETSTQSQSTSSSTTKQQETTVGQMSSQSQSTQSTTTLGLTTTDSQTTQSSTILQQATTFGQTSTGQSTQGATLTSTNSSTQAPTTLGATTVIVCIDGARMPDLTNCRKFFKCQDSVFVSISCPFTYVYHIQQQICRPTADCGERPII